MKEYARNDVHWKYSKDRVYLYGNVQLDILSILMKLLPQHLHTRLSHAPNVPTNLGKLLIMLHRELFTIMLASCLTYYIEDHKIPDQYLLYTYSPDFVFPPQTVQCFKYTQE